LFAPDNKAGDVIKGKELKGMGYKAMRPSADGAGMEIVKRVKDCSKLSKTFGADKPRGNMGIYICPGIDCQHIADADLQAAFNIAVRGYLKSTASKSDRLDKETLCERQSELEYEPVEL
jgi:hypothetical protein